MKDKFQMCNIPQILQLSPKKIDRIFLEHIHYFLSFKWYSYKLKLEIGRGAVLTGGKMN